MKRELENSGDVKRSALTRQNAPLRSWVICNRVNLNVPNPRIFHRARISITVSFFTPCYTRSDSLYQLVYNVSRYNNTYGVIRACLMIIKLHRFQRKNLLSPSPVSNNIRIYYFRISR